jgi:predicted Fe-Mo cluster-binding NifX family protein
MKIAVSATGQDANAQVDTRFGRAAGFVLVDTDDGAISFIPNTQNLEAAQGAGIQAAKLVADRGAQVVMTGHCGPKAFRTLQAAGIAVVVGASGTVGEAIGRYSMGELQPAASPDVEGHWT